MYMDKKEYLFLYMKSQRQINRVREMLEEIKKAEDKKDILITYAQEYKECVELEQAIRDKLYREKQEAEKTCKKVLRSIESMDSGPEKELIKMRYVEGINWDEIAERLGYSETYIYRLHKKALEALVTD